MGLHMYVSYLKANVFEVEVRMDLTLTTYIIYTHGYIESNIDYVYMPVDTTMCMDLCMYV